jgi:catechol 2,3-dioxygenase-like lactoylglutathione lyase family enzyme
VRLNQVTLASHDVPRALEFYRKLGLKLIVRNLPAYARFVCPDGDSTLSVELDPDRAGSSGTVVFFECDDIDARYAALKAEGLHFVSEPQDRPWLWREARLSDPDGNELCLFKAGHNRLFPPWCLPSE